MFLISLLRTSSLFVSLILTSFTVAAAGIENYDELVEKARNGDYAPFLSALRNQELRGRVLNDFIAVAGWAGRGEDSIQAYEKYGQAALLPEYALLQLARAYRDNKKWGKALAAYEQGTQRFPAQNSLALAETSHASELAPQCDDVALDYVLALKRVKMSDPALWMAQKHPGAVKAQLLRSLEAGAAAALARMAEPPPRRREEERFVVADRALANFERLMTQWSRLPQTNSGVCGSVYQRYSNNTREAQKRIGRTVESAPNNIGLREGRARVLRSRQPPRAAEIELKMAQTLAPRALIVEQEQGLTAMGLQEWRQAEVLQQDLAARFPENLGVQNLVQAWQTHNKAELKVDARHSDGPKPRDLLARTTLYASPLSLIHISSFTSLA